MTNEVIPVLIDINSAQGKKIVEKVVKFIEDATKKDLTLIREVEKNAIRRVSGSLREELEEIKCTSSCEFQGYTLIIEGVNYVLFQLANKQYVSSSSFEWSGDYFDVYRDSLALLTPQLDVFGLVPFLGSYYDPGNDLLSKNIQNRIRKVIDLEGKLRESGTRIDVPRCEGHTYLSEFARFIYEDVEGELKKAEAGIESNVKNKRAAIGRARNLLKKI